MVQSYEPQIVGIIDIALLEILDNWLSALKNQRRYSENTVKAYLKDVAGLVRFLSDHNGGTVTLDILVNTTVRDYRSWLAAMVSNGRSHRSNARAISAVKSLLHFIEHINNIEIKSIDFIQVPKLPQLLPHPINLDIILDVLNMEKFKENEQPWVTLRDKALYVLLYGAGLRIQEALDLRKKDIGAFLNILGKGKKQRSTPLIDNVKSILENYLASCPFIDESDNDSYIFFGESGKRLLSTTIEHKLQRIRQAQNWPDYFTPHALRHSFASHLTQEGADMRYVQELLGHSSMTSTQIYTKISNQHILDIYKRNHPLETKMDDKSHNNDLEMQGD